MSGITHKKVVVGPNDPAFEVSKDEWNNTHDYSGLDAATLEGSNKATVQDHVPKAHTLASHSTKDHSELTNIGADDHHASGNVKDYTLGVKTGIKAGTNITITDDGGYAKIAASSGGGGAQVFTNSASYNDTIDDGYLILELDFELAAASVVLITAPLSGWTGQFPMQGCGAKLLIDDVEVDNIVFSMAFDLDISGGYYFSSSLSRGIALAAGSHTAKLVFNDGGSGCYLEWIGSSRINALAVPT